MRSLEKRWAVRLTCLTSRVIYRDLVPILTNDSLISTTRNFNLKREPIRQIFSDCGTKLQGTQSELRNAVMEINVKKVR